MSVLSRFAARTPEETARRRFGLWAAVALVILLPLWWLWGADLAAAALRPLVGGVLALFGLTGRIDLLPDGDWSIGTRLTQAGQAVDYPLSRETLRRILLAFPLAAAFMIAPPRPTRPWRTAAVTVVALSLVFALSVVTVVWGELAPLLDPRLAGAGMGGALQLDQSPLHPFAAQVAIVGRYIAMSIAPLLSALLLWAALNPVALQTLAAEIKDEPHP